MEPRAFWRYSPTGRLVLTIESLEIHARFYLDRCQFTLTELRRTLEPAADRGDLALVLDKLRNEQHQHRRTKPCRKTKPPSTPLTSDPELP